MSRGGLAAILGWMLLGGIAVEAAPPTTVGGIMTSNTIWSLAMSPILATSDLAIPAGLSLRIEAGVTVAVSTNISIQIEAGGTFEVAGSETNPVTFISAKGDENWGPILADGANSSIVIRHAEISHGNILLNNGANGLIEDSFIHDAAHPITANAALLVTLRRIHVRGYASIAFNSGTIILAEDSLFENMTAANSDALEIQAGPEGSIIRGCTFRHSPGDNSDALDFNGTTGVLVENCLIYDFSDKGISLGAAAAGRETDHGIIVRNCCIYGNGIGIAVKDGSTAAIYNNTITKCASGMRLYQKFAGMGGGQVTNSYGNIVAGNTTNLVLLDGSTLVGNQNDFQGQPVAGTGNSDLDPVFLDSARNDFRLAPASPLIADAADHWGALFPVGASMASSQPFLGIETSEPDRVTISFWADSEKSYSLLASEQINGAWQEVQSIAQPAIPTLVSVPLDPFPGWRFFLLLGR